MVSKIDTDLPAPPFVAAALVAAAVAAVALVALAAALALAAAVVWGQYLS